MRNWNLSTKLYPLSLSQSFYSTYEELKHSIWMEDGKGKFCFYSTYEELKLIVGIETFCKSPVFTVPMRNWNL